MPANRSLVAPSANPLLERALREKLSRRRDVSGGLGELEPLAIRLGLMHNTVKPRFREPRLLVFAADHGLAVDGLGEQARETHELVQPMLTGQQALSAFARSQQLDFSVIDCGLAFDMRPHERLMARKIAHGTRNVRTSPAMSVEQAHAAMRAGMEIGDSLRGNMVACAGVGVGSHESAALVLARLTGRPVLDFIVSGPGMDKERLAHEMAVLQAAQARHRDVSDPVEVLAAFGGFEVAVMVGVMLVAASKRHLLMIDGLPACAALAIAQRIAAPVTDYCVFCRSHAHRGLDSALKLFHATALLELGLDTVDGTGAVLAWPLVRCAAALLTDVADFDEPATTRPGGLHEPAAVRSWQDPRSRPGTTPHAGEAFAAPLSGFAPGVPDDGPVSGPMPWAESQPAERDA